MKNTRTPFELPCLEVSKKQSGFQMMEVYFQLNDLAISKREAKQHYKLCGKEE